MNKIQNININELTTLPSPESYFEKIPLKDNQAKLVQNSRESIQKIISGEDKRLLLLVGPCSIHDTKAGIEIMIRSVTEPFKQIIRNGSNSPEAILSNVSNSKSDIGYDAREDKLENISGIENFTIPK